MATHSTLNNNLRFVIVIVTLANTTTITELSKLAPLALEFSLKYSWLCIFLYFVSLLCISFSIVSRVTCATKDPSHFPVRPPNNRFCFPHLDAFSSEANHLQFSLPHSALSPFLFPHPLSSPFPTLCRCRHTSFSLYVYFLTTPVFLSSSLSISSNDTFRLN